MHPPCLSLVSYFYFRIIGGKQNLKFRHLCNILQIIEYFTQPWKVGISWSPFRTRSRNWEELSHRVSSGRVSGRFSAEQASHGHGPRSGLLPPRMHLCQVLLLFVDPELWAGSVLQEQSLGIAFCSDATVTSTHFLQMLHALGSPKFLAGYSLRVLYFVCTANFPFGKVTF